MYSMTVFKPPRWWEQEQRWVYDNKTHRRVNFERWEQFVKFLTALSKRPLEGKLNAELISPAIFEPEAKRRNKHVLAWAGWCAVDVDDWVFKGDLKDELSRRIGDWDYVVYSTASSTREHPKFRLVFNLSRHVAVSEIKHFWFALQSRLDDRGDKQCKDFCRMYYTPAEYAGSHNFLFVNAGNPIDVDSLLDQYPYSEQRSSAQSFIERLPTEWQSLIVEHRKSALDNTSYTWTSYQDCPFVSKRMLDDWFAIAHTDGTGRYRAVYKMMISIARKAIKAQYPITTDQLVTLIRQIDADSSRKYQHRPLDIEANNALEYAYRHTA